MGITGKFFDGRTAGATDVDIELHPEGTVRIIGTLRDGSPLDRTEPLRDIKISERIGNTHRRLAFRDGGVCELADNDALDAWLTEQRGHSLEHRVFRLEQRWRIAIAALIVTLAGSWLAIRYGVPVVANYAARSIPASVDSKLGVEGLLLLDKTIFQPSELPQERQDAIRSEFERMVEELDQTHSYRLEFRRGKRIGANAFALPSGIVVITDELILLAEDPREIYAVLGHEIGHVVNRHALRMVLQSSASAALIVALLGDFTSISNLISAAPAVLVQAKYSRSLETEADDFAYEWMKRHGIPSHFLGDMLLRLEAEHDTRRGRGRRSDDDDFDFFSSHPRPKERVRE